ncbi:CRAL/TRIO domain-containing protein [Hirsutella rhossiliensis]|uniref:Phosphatidylinositol transfer protein SFH5 n=1 Tax=Hirsutella rhossiliensis TaxID=111463 RepID=A0A9P8MP47_9HYPO|nr:CRAL/TRIO domain-containing protein [Hirsutella rhossiliensis]KAH0958847.1 CRAL/TRIO domain-containing protein [Hirsutella rhossiliensis]
MATTTEEQTPLAQLAARLPQMVAQAGHSEMWGVELASAAVASSPDQQQQDKTIDDAPTQVVLHKFLRANNDDVDAAEKQLTAALEWRKAVDPASLVAQPFDARRFGGLGFVTTHQDEAGKEVVVTWNVYGSVKDNKATFGNVQDFIKWRAALMELGVQKLRLNDIKEPIPAGAEDPHRMIQVHDYQSVSFFRMDPDVKAASRETIQTLSMAYPELLAHKYFVNVPAIMGWVFGAMKFFLAPATLRKFHPMASGTSLAAELKGIAQTLPSEYGGQGPSVKEGLTTAPLAAVPEPKDQEKPATEEQLAKTTPTTAAVASKAEKDSKPAEETKAGVEAAAPPAMPPAMPPVKEATQ